MSLLSLMWSQGHQKISLEHNHQTFDRSWLRLAISGLWKAVPDTPGVETAALVHGTDPC